jgi:hypothetical protein
MTYEYISSAGNSIERQFSMKDAIPAEVEVDGVVYRRVFSVPQVLYQAPGFKATDTSDAVTKWQREHLNAY